MCLPSACLFEPTWNLQLHTVYSFVYYTWGTTLAFIIIRCWLFEKLFWRHKMRHQITLQQTDGIIIICQEALKLCNMSPHMSGTLKIKIRVLFHWSFMKAPPEAKTLSNPLIKVLTCLWSDNGDWSSQWKSLGLWHGIIVHLVHHIQRAHCPKRFTQCFSPCLFIPHGTPHCKSPQEKRKDKTDPWYRARQDTLHHVRLLTQLGIFRSFV